MFGLGVYPAVGRAVVPIAGMMIGNSIGSIVVASRRILGELADRRPEVEARLALGQPWQEASRPFVRSALRTALTSQIESTKAVGLVFLPGAMTGLILAGADPVDAVLVQAAIMYLILGCVATNVVVIGLGLTGGCSRPTTAWSGWPGPAQGPPLDLPQAGCGGACRRSRPRSRWPGTEPTQIQPTSTTWSNPMKARTTTRSISRISLVTWSCGWPGPGPPPAGAGPGRAGCAAPGR